MISACINVWITNFYHQKRLLTTTSRLLQKLKTKLWRYDAAPVWPCKSTFNYNLSSIIRPQDHLTLAVLRVFVYLIRSLDLRIQVCNIVDNVINKFYTHFLEGCNIVCEDNLPSRFFSQQLFPLKSRNFQLGFQQFQTMLAPFPARAKSP